MAYMMQHLKMSIMDAYLFTRARRLNGKSTTISFLIPSSFTTPCFPASPLLALPALISTRRIRGTVADIGPVLIQPNLRFFHELFGWEVELARREEDERTNMVHHQQARKGEGGLVEGLSGLEVGGKKREIMYSWPSFCRDLVSFRANPSSSFSLFLFPSSPRTPTSSVSSSLFLFVVDDRSPLLLALSA